MVFTYEDSTATPAGCSLTVGQVCQDGLWPPTNGPLTLVSGTCNYSTYQISNSGCDVYSLNALWTFLNDYYYLWGAAFIIIGIILGFWGH